MRKESKLLTKIAQKHLSAYEVLVLGMTEVPKHEYPACRCIGSISGASMDSVCPSEGGVVITYKLSAAVPQAQPCASSSFRIDFRRIYQLLPNEGKHRQKKTGVPSLCSHNLGHKPSRFFFHESRLLLM